jgi:hypothetical protein
MARRPEFQPNDAMTPEQLKEMRRGLLLLSPHIVKERYKVVVDKCRFVDLPSPKVVQELVTLWKVLWKWRK